MKSWKIVVLSLLLLTGLVFLAIVTHEPSVHYYETHEAVLHSLMRESEVVLTVVDVDAVNMLAVFYNQTYEAISMAKVLRRSEAKYTVEERSSSWKIGGESPTMISGTTKIAAREVKFYAWVGEDTFKGAVGSRVIEQNIDRVMVFEDDVYLLVLLN